MTKKEQLINRINDNFADFKASLRGVSRDGLFKMAGRIAAVSEAHLMLTTEYTWDECSDGEVDFYLLFRDPLTIIADTWENYKDESLIDFDDALFTLSFDDRVISQYPLMEGVSDDIIYIGEPEHKILFYSEI